MFPALGSGSPRQLHWPRGGGAVGESRWSVLEVASGRFVVYPPMWGIKALGQMHEGIQERVCSLQTGSSCAEAARGCWYGGYAVCSHSKQGKFGAMFRESYRNSGNSTGTHKSSIPRVRAKQASINEVGQISVNRLMPG